MNCLLVVAHPLPDSLCHHAARVAHETLLAGGHGVTVTDLYAEEFSPALTTAERRTYYQGPYDGTAVAEHIARLKAAEGLVLVFPTWWFGLPAMLKGWFDRVWAPGVAYDHAADLGSIRPRLHRLRRTLAVTSLGAPWWADRLVMGRPVRRQLKTALLGTCAPACRLEMLSLYRAEAASPARVDTFVGQVRRTLVRWPGPAT